MDHSQHLPQSHEPWIVVLSVLMAILASYAALELGGRVAFAHGRARAAWLAGGAFVMGLGIWCMHFIAMLAFRLPIAVRYDTFLTVLSALIAMGASALALSIVSREKVAWWHIGLGGVVMGLAIAGMHYTGMAALRLRADLSYDPTLFAASIIIAVVASMAALFLLTRFRIAVTRTAQIGKVISAIVMGLAIAGMHYTGMAASRFAARDDFPVSAVGAIEITVLGTTAIALGVVAVIIVALLGSAVGQRLSNFNLTRKFLLISLLFAFPIIVTTALFSAEQYARIEQFGYRELDGAYYLRPLFQLLTSLGRHQIKVDQLNRAEVQLEEVLAIHAEIDQHFAELDVLDAQYGTILDTTDDLRQLKTEWGIFRANILTQGPFEQEGAHTTFSTSILALASKVGNNSQLIVDPDVVTFYPMDAVLFRLPSSQRVLAQTALIGGQAVLRDNLTTSDLVNLQSNTTNLDTLVSDMERGLLFSYEQDTSGTMRPTVDPALAKYRVALLQFNNYVNNNIATAPNSLAERQQLLQYTAEAQQALAELYPVMSQVLEVGIQARIGNLTNRLASLIGFTLLTSVLALVFGLFVFRAINQPINQLTRATQQLAAGDLSVRVNLTGTDEPSQLALAFNNMALRLQETQSEISRRARVLEVSAEVTRRLSTILNEEALVRAVVHELQTAFNYNSAQIFLYDETEENLIIRAGTGEVGRQMLEQGYRIPRGRGLVGRAAENKAPVLVADTTHDPDWISHPLLADTRSEMVAPILLGDQVLGVIDVQQSLVNGLQILDVDLLHSVAGQVAIALQNARSFASAQRRAQHETFINDLSRKLQGVTNLERVLAIATHELGQSLGARRAQGQLQITPTKEK